MKQNFCWCCLIILAGILNNFSQTNNPPKDLQDWQRKTEKERRENNLNAENKNNNESPFITDIKKNAERKKLYDEEIKRIESILQPNSEDIVKFEKLLNQPNTGIFRLIPDFGCEDKLIFNAEGNCAKYIPNGWIYSFRERNYPLEFLSDIRLDQGKLLSNGFLAQGIFVELGDISLEDVTLTTTGMQYLVDYGTAKNITEAKNQSKEIAQGLKSGNYIYSNAINYKENITYGLRLIAYKVSSRTFFKLDKYESREEGNYKFSVFNDNKRNDLTLAFRIIRKDTDGSLTIIWKELDKKKSPKIGN